jgi:hypothetical protein
VASWTLYPMCQHFFSYWIHHYLTLMPNLLGEQSSEWDSYQYYQEQIHCRTNHSLIHMPLPTHFDCTCTRTLSMTQIYEDNASCIVLIHSESSKQCTCTRTLSMTQIYEDNASCIVLIHSESSKQCTINTSPSNDIMSGIGQIFWLNRSGDRNLRLFARW